MAATTSRVVELQIKLQGVQSLQELEDVTAEINKEMKTLSTTSKEFTQMGNLAKKANSQLKEVGESLAGITSTEKAEAVNKMGMALVGAFQGAAGASLLFGEKTGKAMQETITKVGGLFAVTDSLKKITEAFSAKNITALKSVVKGWQESAIAAKLFGNATKTAIASTGIGLFVVAIGFIAANWDKVSAAMKSAFNWLKQFYPPFQWISDIVEYINEKVGGMANLIKGVAAALGALFTSGESMADAFDAAVKKAKELDAATEAYNTTLKDGKQALEDQNQLLEAQGNKQDQIYKNQIAYNQRLISDIKRLVAAGQDLSEEQQKQLHDAEQENKVLEIKLANYQKETNEKNKQLALDKAKKAIDEARQKAELEANIKQSMNARLIKGYEEDIKKILEQEASNIDIINKAYDESKVTLEQQYDAIVRFNKALDETLKTDLLHLDNLKNYISELDTLATKADTLAAPFTGAEDIVNAFTRITAEFNKQYDIINSTNELINSYTATNDKNRGVVIDISDEEMRKLVILESQKKEIEAMNMIRMSEIQGQAELNSLAIKTNNALNEQLKNKQDNLAAQDLENQKEIRRLSQLSVEAKTRKDFLDIEAQLEAAATKQNELVDEQVALQIEMNKNTETNNALKKENNALQVEAKNLANDVNAISQKQTEIIAKNSTVYTTSFQRIGAEIKKFANQAGSAIGKFMDKWQEQIQAVQSLTSGVFELLAAGADARAAEHQKEIDDYIEANQIKLESDLETFQATADAEKQAKQDAADKILELNAELSDAEGERYEQLQDEIAAQQQALDEAAANEQAALDNKAAAQAKYDADLKVLNAAKEADEKKARALRKKASIVEAIMSGSLAVLSALRSGFPLGLIMAGVYAAMSAIQIATIKKQPDYAEGGFTKKGSKYEVAGIVHAGEYVVPQHVVNNNRASGMISALESMRVKGYANGGTVTTPTPAVAAQSSYIDYKQIGSEVASALKANPMFVSVVEFRQVESRLAVVENRASI